MSGSACLRVISTLQGSNCSARLWSNAMVAFINISAQKLQSASLVLALQRSARSQSPMLFIAMQDSPTYSTSEISRLAKRNRDLRNQQHEGQADTRGPLIFFKEIL